MYKIKRYRVVLENENRTHDTLPIYSSKLLGDMYESDGAAKSQLEDLYAEIRRYTCSDEMFNADEGFFTVTCLGIPLVGKIEEIVIPLTAAEADDIYRECENGFKEEDCRNAIYGYAGFDPDLDREEADIQSCADNDFAAQSFYDMYGFSICDLAEGEGEEGKVLRKKIIARFDDIFDANIDPNSLWEEAVRMVLNEQIGIRMHKNIGK